jgi:murein peptide amidase A
MPVPVALPVGHSVEGRPIRAFGSGSDLLLVGCIHGNECAAVGLVRRFIGVHGVVVLPQLNPDGFRAGTRFNARGVDLNRDFYARTQPETRYAVSLIRRLRPRVTIWFHQPERRVRAWGQSRAIARRFASFLGGLLPYAAVAWPPGSASNWQNHAFPRDASFVVELPPGPLRDQRPYVRALRRLLASVASSPRR